MRSNSKNGTMTDAASSRRPGHSRRDRDAVTERRRERRFRLELEIHWDFFSIHDGLKPGQICDLSPRGCLLQARHPIELRRWLRLMIPVPGSVVRLCCVARTVWKTEGRDGILFYGIEFVRAIQGPWIEELREHAVQSVKTSNFAPPVQDLLTSLHELQSPPSCPPPRYVSLLNGKQLS